MSSDFYTTSIVPFAPIIIKICRAYTNTQEDFEDYYQEVCLQPDSGLDSYHYLKAFHGWLKDRMARSKRVQRHLYAVTFLALAIGAAASASGQVLIRFIVESNPDIGLINGVPLVLIAGVVAIAIVVDLLGGVLFDFDVNTAYRNVFRKLDEMVAEMEELRG